MQKTTHRTTHSTSQSNTAPSSSAPTLDKARTISSSTTTTSGRAHTSTSSSLINFLLALIHFIKITLWQRNIETSTSSLFANKQTLLEKILTRSSELGEGFIHIQNLDELNTINSGLHPDDKELIGTLIVEYTLSPDSFHQFQIALAALHPFVKGNTTVTLKVNTLDEFCKIDLNPQIAPLINTLIFSSKSQEAITASNAYKLQYRLNQMLCLQHLLMKNVCLKPYVCLSLPSCITHLVFGNTEGHLKFEKNSVCVNLDCGSITNQGSLVIHQSVQHFSTCCIFGPVNFEDKSNCVILNCWDIQSDLTFIIPKSVQYFDATEISSTTSFENGSECKIANPGVVPEGSTFIIPDSAELADAGNVGKITYNDGTPPRISSTANEIKESLLNLNPESKLKSI